MKKFLTILGAMTLTASMAATVVACANEETPGDDNGESNTFKVPINDVIPITDFGSIGVAKGAKPSLNQIIFAANTVNGYYDLFGFDDHEESPFDDSQWPFSLEPNDFEIKSETDSSAIISAKKDSNQVYGEIEVKWNQIVRPMTDLSNDLVHTEPVIDNETKEDLLTRLEMMNPNLIISELEVGDLDLENKTTTIKAKVGSTLYNQGTPINIKYWSNDSKDLQDVITKTDLGQILPREQKVSDLVKKLVELNSDFKLGVNDENAFIIISKFSMADKSFKVRLVQQSSSSSIVYKGEITITYTLKINDKPTGNDGQGEQEVGWFIPNNFLGFVKHSDLNSETLMAKIKEKNPGLNPNDFKIIIKAKNPAHPFIYVIGKNPNVYNSRSRVIINYVSDWSN